MIAKIHNFGALREALAFNNETLSGYFRWNLWNIERIAIKFKFENVYSYAVFHSQEVCQKVYCTFIIFCCLIAKLSRAKRAAEHHG